MSTLYGDDRSAGEPIAARDDLIDVLRRGEKPAGRWGVGIEYERLPVSRESGDAVPYLAAADRRPSIAELLETLAARGWQAQRESGNIVALERGGTRVTLEPGAQVEMSGRVHAGLLEALAEIHHFVREVDAVAAGMGIAFLGLGFTPFTPFEKIGWVPKRRYAIMAPYLAARGHLAHGMMKGTAGCQINLDYASEPDAMEMLRTATAVSSIVTALCANSPLTLGQANGFCTFRSHIWGHTDPDRCGLLPFALDERARYEDYVDYAMNVPMFFIVRDGEWIDMTGIPFRRFLEEGHRGMRAVNGDWQMHLTTLFPEVRLKSWLEVRGSDSGSPGMIVAQAALWKGILYDPAARRQAWDLVAGAALPQRLAFHRDVARLGLEARLSGRSARDLGRDLVTIAASHLPAVERPLLAPLEEIVATGLTPSGRLLDQWRGPWRRDPARLVEGLAARSLSE